MQYVILLGLAILALYVVSRLIVLAIIEPIVALIEGGIRGAVGVVLLVVGLGLLWFALGLLHELGRFLARKIKTRRAMAACATGFLFLLTIGGLEAFARTFGHWETHWFRPDQWKPDWLKTVILTLLIDLIICIPVAIGLTKGATASGVEDGNAVTPPC